MAKEWASNEGKNITKKLKKSKLTYGYWEKKCVTNPVETSGPEKQLFCGRCHK
jgi:hypothetical protein